MLSAHVCSWHFIGNELAGQPNYRLSDPEPMKRYLPIIIIAVVFSLATGGGSLLLLSKRRALKAEAEAADKAMKSKIGKPGAEPPHVRGPAKAPVTLEEFG